MIESNEQDLEKLFNRFKQLQAKCGSLAGIVQNVMVISESELTNWVLTQALPLRNNLTQLISDVVTFYNNVPKCSWCGERHIGGPEYCRN
jgi:hypothetical protein